MGMSGNPAGEPKGARNKATALLEAIADDDLKAIVAKAVDRAKGRRPGHGKPCSSTAWGPRAVDRAARKDLRLAAMYREPTAVSLAASSRSRGAKSASMRRSAFAGARHLRRGGTESPRQGYRAPGSRSPAVSIQCTSVVTARPPALAPDARGEGSHPSPICATGGPAPHPLSRHNWNLGLPCRPVTRFNRRRSMMKPGWRPHSGSIQNNSGLRQGLTGPSAVA
jgi:hypothetical protein